QPEIGPGRRMSVNSASSSVLPQSASAAPPSSASSTSKPASLSASTAISRTSGSSSTTSTRGAIALKSRFFLAPLPPTSEPVFGSRHKAHGSRGAAAEHGSQPHGAGTKWHLRRSIVGSRLGSSMSHKQTPHDQAFDPEIIATMDVALADVRDRLRFAPHDER